MDINLKTLSLWHYILINLLINFLLFVILYFSILQYSEYRKNKTIESVVSNIYENISYNLAIPDHVEIQRQINRSSSVSEIVGIVVIDNFGNNIWSSHSEKQKIRMSDIKQNILFEDKRVGSIGIALNDEFFSANFKKMTLIMSIGHFSFFVLSIFITARMHAKKIEELEWQKAISERKLEIVGKLAACITLQLKQPVLFMEKNFANSRYSKTIKKIQKYIDRIQAVAVALPDEDAEDINNYVDVAIRANKREKKMKNGKVVIPISAGKYLKKRI